MDAQLYTPDYIVIAGFFISMIVIGIYFAGRMKDSAEYFSGGKNIPWWISGISFYMSSQSAFAFIAYSSLAYRYGWMAVTIYWVTVPATLVSAYFFAARWRRAANTSPIEFIEERYSNKMRQALAWVGIPMKVIDDALKLFAISTLLTVGLGVAGALPEGWSEHAVTLAVIASGLIILAYTFLGGIWAVMVTDFVQFVVLAVVIVLLLPLSIAAAGGWTGFTEGVPDGFFSLINTEFQSAWYVVAFLLILTLGNSSQWHLVQRYYSVRRDKDARKVGYMVAILNFVTPPLMFLPAMAATVFLPGVEDPSQIYGVLCKYLLPIGMLGMLVAAMFAATMSMLSSDYNAVSSVLTHDIYKRLINPKATDKELVLCGRLTTLGVGLAALSITFLIMRRAQETELLDMMIQLFAVFLPPIAIPVLTGLLTRKINSGGGLTGLVGGTVAGAGVFMANEIWGSEGAFLAAWATTEWITLTSVLATVIGMVVGTALTSNSAKQNEKVETLFERLEAPEASLERVRTRKGARPEFSPFPIIGGVVVFLGLLQAGAVFFFSPVERVDERGMSLIVGFLLVATGAAFFFAESQSRKRARGRAAGNELPVEEEVS